MKRYNSYKPSGISWIGEIPSHWETSALRKHLKLVSLKGFAEKPLLSVTREAGVIIRDVESKEENHNYIPENLSGYKLVMPGQFAVNKMKSWQGSYGVSKFEGIVSPAYYVCNLEFPDVRFFNWAIRSKAYIPFFSQMSKGIRTDQWDLSTNALKSIPIFVPPLAEQERIVAYLSTKTSLIQAQQREKERELRLLEELKQAEIASAVTRGLNLDVPMKDSGVPWIGMIPAHWEVTKIRTLYAERTQKVSDKDFEPLSVSKQGVTLQLEGAVKTDNGDNRKLVRKGDFVVNSRSDRKGSCGVSLYDGSVSLINIVLYPIRKLVQGYFHLLFRSNSYVEEFYRLGHGIVADLWTTNFEDMRNIYVPLPPIEEQRSIVEYIETKTRSIDEMISNLKAEIEYLTEYKQRLIADVVTGQINVQDLNANE